MTRTKTRTHIVFGLMAASAAVGAVVLASPQGSPTAVAADVGNPPIAVTNGTPVLLELFTSQGCSSCPPADKLAETLSHHPGLVVISRPVTYWDRLGWKDTLARESNTALQQDYALRGLAGTNGVYTPQLVVDGNFGAVGSRGDDVAAGVKRYGGKGNAAIRVVRREDAGFTVDLAGAGQGPAELLLVAVARKVDVVIGSGENGGHKVSYVNVLRAERKIADYAGGKASVTIGPRELNVSRADRFAVVLRRPDGGPVLAARWLS